VDGQAVLMQAGEHDGPTVLLTGVDFALEVFRQATFDLAPRRRPSLSLDFPDVNTMSPWSGRLFADDLVAEEFGIADQQFQLICAAHKIMESRERGPQFRRAIDCR